MTIIDRVLYGGRIYTQDDRQPVVSALACMGERIVAFGSDDDMLRLAGPDTRRENLNGQTVIPGLVDAHIHWQMTSESLQQVNLFDVPSRERAVELVAERAARTPAGTWIRGFGWAQDLWPDRAFPTATDLDTVAPGHPVYLQSRSIHSGWANSAALRLAGVDSSTSDPEGGQIQRDANGQPTGILHETAMRLIDSKIPKLSLDQIAAQMREAQALALSVGLTGFHDFDDPDCLRALQLLRERGQLELRVVKNINKGYINAALESGLRWGFGDDWIRLGGVKLFADGAMGPRTASMLQPYDGEPENFGIVVTDKEEMVEWVSRASAGGLPATIHAIGDRAVRDVLDVYEFVRQEEALRGEAPASRRHRIEHVQIIHPDDIPRMKALNLIASMQPIHATSDYQMADRYWGTRSSTSYNPRLQLDQGVVVAFGSDAPVESFNPWWGIHAAVTRQRPDGSPGPDGWYPSARVTIAEALRAYTIGPAYTAGSEKRLGRLAPGYLADLVVLRRDPFTIPAAELLEMTVVATMVGNVWRFGGL